MSNYLSYEEQFKDILNQEEIQRIEDQELRSIRAKYWTERHKVFLDERGVPDDRFGGELDKIMAKEKAEIRDYKKRKGLLD